MVDQIESVGKLFDISDWESLCYKMVTCYVRVNKMFYELWIDKMIYELWLYEERLTFVEAGANECIGEFLDKATLDQIFQRLN